MPEDKKLSRDGSPHVTDETINSVTHLAAAIFAVVGGALLVGQAIATHDIWTIASLSIYALSLVTLFVLSTLHHSIDAGPRANHVMRTLDYSAVFFLIAGTVTPLCLIGPRTTAAWVVLGATWLLAAAGIALRASIRHLPKHYTNTMYICIGWLPVVLVLVEPHRFSALVVALLAAGGLCYTLGFVMYMRERPNPVPGRFGFHELWHIFVIAGALLQYLAIYFYAFG